jgi:3-isopropylmalate/(R)-2-methylmalate dehydratase large subunit
VTAKDLVLARHRAASAPAAAGARHRVPRRGDPRLSIEGRMTVCNMSIEAGARAGMIAPDETTFEYLRGRPHAPTRRRLGRGRRVLAHLRTDDDATFDRRS